MAAVLFPLVFFSFGAYAIDYAARLATWLHAAGHQMGLMVITADGILTAALIVLMSEVAADAWFRTGERN